MEENLLLITLGLGLILPYVAGSMIHNFQSRKWEQAIGWLLVLSFCLTAGPTALLIGAVEAGESDLNLQIVNITPWVMVAQGVLWGLLLFGYLRGRKSGGWKTVAVTACLISLAVGFLIPVSFNAARGQRIAQDEEILAEVSYVPYPGAEFPDSKYEHVGGGPGHECLSVRFLTDDDPGQVFEFYGQCAENAGLQVRSDITGDDETNVQWATGDSSVAMKVEQVQSPNEWKFSVYWSADYTVAVDSDGHVYVVDSDGQVYVD